MAKPNSQAQGAANPNAITKQVDETAYAKMIEDFTRFVLRTRHTVHLMRLMPQLAHAGFISQKTKEAILASFDKLLNEHAVRERAAIVKDGDGTVMIDTGLQMQDDANATKQFLCSEDRDFI